VQWGHPIESIWAYTPKEAHAWMTLGAARHSRERATRLADGAVAAQADGKQIKRAIDDLLGA
jgi:hypothetical protein